ncbi:hypothetical protein OROGR_009210 [Orobanche gracilis]
MDRRKRRKSVVEEKGSRSVVEERGSRSVVEKRGSRSVVEKRGSQSVVVEERGSERRKSVALVEERGSEKSVSVVKERGSEKSVAVVEERGSQILFVEVCGSLMGIDLNVESDLHAPPAVVPIRYHMNLVDNGYPIGMRHVKINGEIYLLGGALRKPSHVKGIGGGGGGWTGYSNQIYRFNPCRLTIGDVYPSHVLEPLTHTALAGAKVPIVANLKGATYLLHRWIPHCIPYLEVVDVPFERLSFDASTFTLSCHQHPSPPFVKSDRVKPFPYYPVSSHFVLDDKLLLFCNLDHRLHTFSPRKGTGEWTTSIDGFYRVSDSFNCRGTSLPPDGLWLSNLTFPHDDSLGVLLSVQMSCDNASYDEIRNGYSHPDIPQEYVYSGDQLPFFLSYKVYAYAMSKTTFEVKLYQPLDHVLSGVIPDPISTPLISSTISHHFLDLGKGDGGEGITRVCALLTGVGLIDGIRYLFISIFDLQMTQENIRPPKRPSRYSHFLKVVTLVKKLAFRLDKHCSNDDEANEVCFQAFCNPILDAFIL